MQAAFNTRSMSLYTKLGYEIREPLACINGPRISAPIHGHGVRPATEADLDACNDLCRRIHGHDRAAELASAVQRGSARVVEHGGRIAGYASDIGFFGHAVAETNDGLCALIAAAEQISGPGLLLPSRNMRGVPVEPGKWTESGPADDADVERAVQQAARSVHPVDSLLKSRRASEAANVCVANC